MPTLHFDLVIDRDLTGEADANALYEAFDDVSPAVANGVPVLMFTAEAESIEAAVRPLLPRLRAMGVHVREVRFEPDAVLA